MQVNKLEMKHILAKEFLSHRVARMSNRVRQIPVLSEFYFSLRLLFQHLTIALPEGGLTDGAT